MSLIVGDEADPHVAAVVAETAMRGADPIVINAATLRSERWRTGIGGFEILRNDWRSPRRGWLRRLAPAGHHEGTVLGSVEAAEIGARLALLASLDDTQVEWLAGYWATVRAENKLVQYRTAQLAGVPTPPTQVAARAADLDLALGDPLVFKPLGIGDYLRNGVPHAVHTRLASRNDPALDGLGESPFLAQQRVEAARHLRVVTVLGEAWVSSLDADGLPLDWRSDTEAHHSWSPAHRPDVAELAIRLALGLNVGYTSQDWIVDRRGDAWFIDANPGGQWLFLPDRVSDPVTAAIADWLSGRAER